MKKLISACVATELYVAGVTEDGHNFNAERFYVVAEYSNGERLRHESTFPGCNPQRDPEDGYMFFEDIRKSAFAEAKRLAERVTQAIGDGLALNMDYWSEERPVYGSVAYSNEAEIEIERQERDQQNN